VYYEYIEAKARYWNWFPFRIHRRYLPITVKLTKEFRVGEPWKSTRHLYEPASISRTFSTARWVPAGRSVSVTRKKARPPRACSSVQCVAWSSERPRASRLQSNKNNINSSNARLAAALGTLHTVPSSAVRFLYLLIFHFYYRKLLVYSKF